MNIGLPMYITIDRKPENGCKIQNATCSVSGVMLRLLLVKSEEDSELHIQKNAESIAHGTQILKYLTLHLANSNRRVCADSYFVSVSSAEELMKIRLRFIDVVKTATKKYPMSYLSGGNIRSKEAMYWSGELQHQWTPIHVSIHLDG